VIFIDLGDDCPQEARGLFASTMADLVVMDLVGDRLIAFVLVRPEHRVLHRPGRSGEARRGTHAWRATFDATDVATCRRRNPDPRIRANDY
jgi:hypothetical protein